MQASAIKSMICSCVAAGVNIFIFVMFSEPKPLGATVIFTLSPGTIEVYRMHGVLSLVFSRRSGSPTTDRRR